MARRISAANAPVSPTDSIAGWLATIRSTSVVPVRGSPATNTGAAAEWPGGAAANQLPV